MQIKLGYGLDQKCVTTRAISRLTPVGILLDDFG